jgi:thiol-disulfide isomerase/thioredoxin
MPSRIVRSSGLAALSLLGALAASCRAQGPEELVAADAAGPASAPARVRIVEAPASGDVQPIVRDAVAAARAAPGDPSGVLVVYVGATWCEPCQRFHHAAERGDLDATFPGLTLLEFDLDRDRERLASAGYTSKLIPLFALPASGGAASGKQVEGGIKGDGAVAFMVPRLKALLGHGS